MSFQTLFIYFTFPQKSTDIFKIALLLTHYTILNIILSLDCKIVCHNYEILEMDISKYLWAINDKQKGIILV